MVYMSGSKMARRASSIINRPTCGGDKKSGTVNGVGFVLNGKYGTVRNRTSNLAASFDSSKRDDCSAIIISRIQHKFNPGTIH